MPDGNLHPDPVGRLILTDTDAVKAARRLASELAEDEDGLMPTEVEIHDSSGWLVTTVPVMKR